MTILRRFYLLLKNVFSLLKAMSRYDRFYWDLSACKVSNCQIDETAMVYGNFMLTNVKIGYSSYISFNAFMANTTVGRFCSIGPNIVSGVGIHPIDGISTHPAFYSSKRKSKVTFCTSNTIEEHKPVSIGNDVFIGANVTILDGITIGDGAVIGAGSVVSKDIPPYAVAVGCPIKIIKYRFSESIVNDLLLIKWWNRDNETLIKAKNNFYNVEEFIESER